MDLYDLALSGTSLLFSYLSLNLLSTIRKNSHELSKYNNLSVYSPKPLLEHLQSLPSLKSLKSLKSPSPLSDSYTPIGKFLVSGEISCDDPIPSLTHPKTNLIYRIYNGTFTQKHEYLTQHDYKFSDPTQISKTYARDSVAFALKGFDKRGMIRVIPSVNIDCNYAMETLGKDMQLPNEVEDKAWGLVNMLGGFLTGNNDKVLKLSTYFVDKEYGVKVGGYVTVFGQVLYNSEKKDMKMIAETVFKNIGQIRQKVWENTKCYFALGLVIGGLCVSVGLLVRRMMKLYDQYAHGMKAPALKRGNTSSVLTDDYKCVVCFVNPKNVILRPCMHFLMCLGCLNKMTGSNCPVCREPIEEYLQIFLS